MVIWWLIWWFTKIIWWLPFTKWIFCVNCSWFNIVILTKIVKLGTGWPSMVGMTVFIGSYWVPGIFLSLKWLATHARWRPWFSEVDSTKLMEFMIKKWGTVLKVLTPVSLNPSFFFFPASEKLVNPTRTHRWILNFRSCWNHWNRRTTFNPRTPLP